uniref:ATP synthase F0 subunit 8 n=1 Tax=Vipera berus TaxID=31155 RepID=A0A343SWC9_VIPBE|nr:ATP synthase F0 subunit 8 [Vipera berus]YP_010263859.1 ATP synthase F0 subunit 8 [Echis carinatus]YP_010263872.1 ATP synthase F0 subunit 8 [Echis coloratus]YP_010384461.1 ATP synthase F0 subunit 8 [Echis omanensis]AUT77195.1 ATP synthase F0 subunit 8 [Vipera berus]QHI42773.1 ATP synthase F0 subunit 8 [Vipera berus]QHI42824.1 ATP synthase F0 subunit 8 [Vipera berus]UGW52620.1 ATP synthase F0 subunit 8 [Echis carinatus]UGW52633.1 ATP synthase F0 subunit 8 [Echis coloratus]
MPQLDIIFILLIFMCAWLTITLISQKMSLLTLTIKPKTPHSSNNQLKTPTLKWM